MDQIKSLYLDFCKTYCVDPNETVLGEIEKPINGPDQTKSFNLSTVILPEAQYTVLGKFFSQDFLFSSINLNDCNLSSEALQSFLHGLVKNTTCRALELKGNKIQGAGTEALANLLRRNQTLQIVRLEWNQIGSMDTPAFGSFCDALGSNKSLIELDLRNNDISHVGGSELAVALKRNSTLRILDLRWNNIGAVGGRALLAVCQSNSTLNELHLAGNDVPDDILQNINNALAKNTEKRQMHFGHSQNMALLARQVQNIHTEKDRQIASLLQRVSIQEQALLKANKSLALKVKKLQEALNDRKLAFNAVSAKNTLLEADLTVVTQQLADAQHDLKKLKINHDELTNKERREHQLEKAEMFNIQEKLQRSLNESLEVQRQLNEKVHDLERKNEILQTTVHELRETITINDREHRLKIAGLDDENQRLKLKHKEELKDNELAHTREMQRLKESTQTREENLKEQIAKLEITQTSLERDVNSLSATISTQKLNHEEDLRQEKLRMKNEDDKRQTEFDNRLRALTVAKDELELQCKKQSSSNFDLQEKNNQQMLEIQSLQSQNDEFKKELYRKEAKIIEVRESLAAECQQKLKLHEHDDATIKELRKTVDDLNERLKETEFKHRNEIREHATRFSDIQVKLHKTEQELTQMKENERKRLQFLRTAMLDYIGHGAKPT